MAVAPTEPELSGSHRIQAVAALIGGLAAGFSALLTWGNGAGLLSVTSDSPIPTFPAATAGRMIFALMTVADDLSIL